MDRTQSRVGVGFRLPPGTPTYWFGEGRGSGSFNPAGNPYDSFGAYRNDWPLANRHRAIRYYDGDETAALGGRPRGMSAEMIGANGDVLNNALRLGRPLPVGYLEPGYPGPATEQEINDFAYAIGTQKHSVYKELWWDLSPEPGRQPSNPQKVPMTASDPMYIAIPNPTLAPGGNNYWYNPKAPKKTYSRNNPAKGWVVYPQVFGPEEADTPAGLPAPANVRIIRISEMSCDIAWDAVPGAFQYHVQRVGLNVVSGTRGLAHRFQALGPGSFSFTVAAVSDSGQEGAKSVPVTFIAHETIVTPPPPPSAPGKLSPAEVRVEELRQMVPISALSNSNLLNMALGSDVRWPAYKPFAVEALKLYRLIRRKLGDQRELP